MSNGPLVKIKAATAAEICVHFDLPEQARRLLRDKMGPREFAEALLANQHHVAAIDFMAHALPAREGVWWGCLCLQHACGNDLTAQDKAACRAAVQWVLQPSEEHRAATTAAAGAAGPGSPGGALAMAANQTGGSLAPPDLPPIPPGPFAPAKAVAMAVKLASIKSAPVKISDTQRLFVGLGIGVAEGRFAWPEIRNKAPVSG